jgi:hypothetical protein
LRGWERSLQTFKVLSFRGAFRNLLGLSSLGVQSPELFLGGIESIAITLLRGPVFITNGRAEIFSGDFHDHVVIGASPHIPVHACVIYINDHAESVAGASLPPGGHSLGAVVLPVSDAHAYFPWPFPSAASTQHGSPEVGVVLKVDA